MTSQSVFAFECELDPDTRVMTISLVGKLDPLATEELTPCVEDAFQSGVRRFVFDLSRLSYVGSLGLRLFVGLHNRLRGQGAVALSNPTSPVLTILDMTKLNRVLRYYPTRREAIDATSV
jgi:anti-sigma B factor antagonist